MKKILGGKKYDTETARMVGNYWNGNSGFGKCYEALYCKRTGEFFLYGEGGPMSKYGVAYGDNEWGYGEEIRPSDGGRGKGVGGRAFGCGRV